MLRAPGTQTRLARAAPKQRSAQGGAGRPAAETRAEVMQSPPLSLEMPAWGRHSGDGDGGRGALASAAVTAQGDGRRERARARASRKERRRAQGGGSGSREKRSRRAEARPEAFEVLGSCSLSVG